MARRRGKIGETLRSSADVVAIGVAAVVLLAPGTSLREWWRERTERIETEKAIEAAWPELLEEGGRLGAADGTTVVVEFGDYECPFCKAGHAALKELTAKRRDLTLVYRHLPLTSIHASALPAARASVCAEEAGRFQAMHDFLYETDAWKEGVDWAEVARTVGVADVEAFTACLESSSTERRLGRDGLLAEELGARSTPTFVGPRGVRTGILDAEGLEEIAGGAGDGS